jgi:type II secretory pathway component PulJ
VCDYIHTVSQTERYKHTRYAIIKNNNETVIVSEKKQSGFTIIELLVFCAIFVISGVAFSSVFLSILQVQSRQTATVEVSRESQFVIQKIQNYIENASVIDALTN